MSGNHLNSYVVSNAKGLNSFESLCSTMFNPTKKNKLAQKIQLTHLREMCIYVSAITSVDESVFSSIVAYLKDLGDADIDRKLYRTAVYLLVETIAEYRSRNELSSKYGSVANLNNILTKELLSKSGSKTLLIWRALGSIAHSHRSSPLLLTNSSSAQQRSSAASDRDIHEQITARLYSTLESLQYPVKQKKTMLFGSDKEFLPKILNWAAVLSAIVHTNEPLPRKCWENLAYGLTCSVYTPLAQHSFVAALNTARILTDESLQLTFLRLLLVEQDTGKPKETLMLNDTLCCTSYVRCVVALAHNCPSLQLIEPGNKQPVENQRHSETLTILTTLLVNSLSFLKSKKYVNPCTLCNAVFLLLFFLVFLISLLFYFSLYPFTMLLV
jgi:hypothetical protein